MLCPICNKYFKKTAPNKKFCSKNCRDKNTYNNHKIQYLATHKRYRENISPETMREYRKKWNKADPIRYAVSKRAEYSNVKAKKLGLPGKLKTKELLDLFNKLNWSCQYCGCKLDEKTITVDHKTPFARGGANVIENITAACLNCNKQKAAKTYEEFIN
jgi:5-methylcytosine-specific restriction endonuclease McrA